MAQLQKFGSPLPYRQFFTNAGLPLALGVVRFRLTGTGTLANTYTTKELASANSNPLTLDAYGRLPGGVFTDPAVAYDIAIASSVGTLGTPIDTVTAYRDPTGLVWNEIARRLGDGHRLVNTGYQVLNTDEMLTLLIDTTPNPLPTVGVLLLDDVNVRSLPLTIVNVGTRPIALSPKRGQTIDGLGPETPFVLPTAVSGTVTYPSVVLVPDGLSMWLIAASHKCP